MNKESKQHRTEAGFTLIEVLVCLIILTMLGFVIWSNFAGGLDVLLKIPATGEITNDLLKLENTFREFLRHVQFPMWVPEYDFSGDKEEVALPYFYGVEGYRLFIYVETDMRTFKDLLIFEGNLDKMDFEPLEPPEDSELKEFKLIFGPYEDVQLREIQNKDDAGLQGVELTIAPLHEGYGEITFFAKIGRGAFWLED